MDSPGQPAAAAAFISLCANEDWKMKSVERRETVRNGSAEIRYISATAALDALTTVCNVNLTTSSHCYSCGDGGAN